METQQTIAAVVAAADAARIAAGVASEAAKMASGVATDAAKAASAAAVESAKVGENIKFIKSEITDIKGRLDHTFVTKQEFEPINRSNADHETRLRRLELWTAMGLGAVTALQLVLKFIIK